MNAIALREFDKFVEVSEAEYAEMKEGERAKLPRRTVEKIIDRVPDKCPGMMHVKTSAGTWCISHEAQVTLV